MAEHLTVTAAPRTLTRRQISVTFFIVNLDGSHDQLDLLGDYAISATITSAGMRYGSQISLTISGMTMNEMNRLSFVSGYSVGEHPVIKGVSQSNVVVRVGAHGKPLSTVFVGQILEAIADYNASPQTVFRLMAQSTASLSATSPTPNTYPGPWTVPALLSDICARHNIVFVNHGGWRQNTQLVNTYTAGSILDQLEKIVRAAQGAFSYNQAARVIISNDGSDNNIGAGTFHAWGPNFSGVAGDNGDKIPVISAKTGMIGYPQYTQSGCRVGCVFRPDITFYDPIVIKSAYLPAGWTQTNEGGQNAQGQQIRAPHAPWNGRWLPTFVQHDLSSEIPGGPWTTWIECQPVATDQQYAISPR